MADAASVAADTPEAVTVPAVSSAAVAVAVPVVVAPKVAGVMLVLNCPHLLRLVC